jgi:hypothetical protein
MQNHKLSENVCRLKDPFGISAANVVANKPYHNNIFLYCNIYILFIKIYASDVL